MLCPCFTLDMIKIKKSHLVKKKNLLTWIRLVLFLVLFIKLWMIFNGRFIDTKKNLKKRAWLCNHDMPRLLLWWPLPPTYMNDKATNRLCDSAVSCLLIFTFIFMVIMKENTFDVWKFLCQGHIINRYLQEAPSFAFLQNHITFHNLTNATSN